MHRHTGSFVAQDPNGRDVTVDKYTEFMTPRMLDGSEPMGEIELTTSLRLANGQAVIIWRKGEYEVEETGVRLTSSDPAAPAPPSFAPAGDRR